MKLGTDNYGAQWMSNNQADKQVKVFKYFIIYKMLSWFSMDESS